MSQPIELGMTYKEHLAQRRAEQFGWETEEVTAIDADSSLTSAVSVPEEKPAKKPRKTTKKEEKEDEV